MNEKWIPDISQWNGTVDFAKVKKQHDAVILRASCGNSKDKNFDANIQAALANGLKVGVYHYLCGITATAADNECRNFYAAIKPYKDKISFFVLDFEDPEMLKLTDSNKIKLYHGFSNRMLGTYGLKNIVLYTWQWLGEKLKAADPEYNFRWEWYADYGKNDGQPNGKVTKGWLHQFTSKTRNDYDQSTFTDMSMILDGHTLEELCGGEGGGAEEEPVSADQNGDGLIVRIVTPEAWNIRAGDGADYEGLGVAKYSEEYEYVATSVTGWLCVRLDGGKLGWISPKGARVIDLKEGIANVG